MANINFKVKNGLEVNGDVDVTNHRITNVAAPTAGTDAATKAYTDSSSSTVTTALTTHIGDATKHLTTSQNTWIDAITASSTEVNRLVGVTSSVQTQLDAKADASVLGDINAALTAINGVLP